jgi:hypothetical protein
VNVVLLNANAYSDRAVFYAYTRRGWTIDMNTTMTLLHSPICREDELKRQDVQRNRLLSAETPIEPPGPRKHYYDIFSKLTTSDQYGPQEVYPRSDIN